MSRLLESNKAIVKTFIEAMGASDSTTAATCLSSSAYTSAKGFGKFAGIRHYDTILATIDAFNKILPGGLRPEFNAFIAEGDQVVVEFEGHATTCDGKPYNNQYCMIFTLKDGKIEQVNEYFCTKTADDVLWPVLQNMSEENT